jgi:hypothetical protein
MKRVWILGSGFSRPLDGPLLVDLLADVPNAISNQNLEVVHHDKSIRQFFRNGLAKRWWRHAEHFLAIVDTARKHTEARLPEVTDAMMRLQLNDGFGAFGGGVEQIATIAKRALLIDVWSFLQIDYGDIASERWAPYREWATRLTADDTVVSFNYDAVPELLKKGGGHLRIVHPTQNEQEKFELTEDEKTYALVLKLHGSVNWYSQKDKPNNIFMSEGNNSPCIRDPQFVPEIGVPGPSKMDVCEGKFSYLWDLAGKAIESANEIILIGYSFPDTDNYARARMLSHLNANARKGSIVLVLGPNSPDTSPSVDHASPGWWPASSARPLWSRVLNGC